MRVPRLHLHMGHWLLLSRLLLGVETLFVVGTNYTIYNPDTNTTTAPMIVYLGTASFSVAA